MVDNGAGQFKAANQFGEWLHDQMYEHRINQPQLAEMVGVNQSTVSNWLRGRAFPGADKIDRLVAVFEVDPSLLYGMLGIKSSKPHKWKYLGYIYEELDKELEAMEPEEREIAIEQLTAGINTVRHLLEWLDQHKNRKDERTSLDL